MEKGMTPMEKFAFELLKQQGNNGLSPNDLAHKWARAQGRCAISSRRMFGSTSAAYRTLRRMAKNGMIKEVITRTKTGWIDEMYYHAD